jgi:hypothetical protein
MDLEICADEPRSFSQDLDENGLPIGSSSDEEESPYESRSGNDPDNSLSEFASAFYSSGSDYSSLIGNKKKNGYLVQTNLLQMWGINKSEAAETSESSFSKENRKRQRRENETDQGHVFGLNRKTSKKGKNPAFAKSRSCPFYKKIPGKFLI